MVLIAQRPKVDATYQTLPLSNSDDVVKISAEDYDFLSQFSWFLKRSRSGVYVCASMRVKSRVLTLRQHRLIANCPDALTVDHINRDHLDNTRENLEIVTREENTRRYWDWWGKERFKDEVPF